MFIPSIVNLLELRYVYEQEIKEAKKVVVREEIDESVFWAGLKTNFFEIIFSCTS